MDDHYTKFPFHSPFKTLLTLHYQQTKIISETDIYTFTGVSLEADNQRIWPLTSRITSAYFL